MKKAISTVLQILVVFALATSCSKDHELPDPDDLSGNEKLQTDILGKWIVETSSGRTMTDNAFLEFLSDSSFIIYSITDTTVTGTFKVTSNTEISLANFGTMSEIKITQDKISFKLAFSGKWLAISAVKSTLVDASDKTKLLSRSWSLTTDESGAILLDNDLGADKATVLISASGTYFAQFLSKGHAVESAMGNWKWHSTKTDRFVYWEDGEPINEETNYMIIRELTKDILKTTDPQPDGTFEYFVYIPD
ncbi:hypothetical protein [Dyadobacter pollutisoli]|uniref:Lipocalin-like domain-containing protein n=1 Tax=Dyadobacter pollutisoli TaxID=2910158 RepID=A0A9E8NDP0_9BACT|nr:hypothetical protein [Dyadobacter pollutisoli]WAC12402.1 hypothetical protein ON006_00275 [Dyadobacter pollutisoli]